MTAHELTADEVAQLNFSQIVGFVNEPNMCSGGAATLRRIMREVPGLGAGQRILEVGSNTGFSVLELAAATRCEVFGIDIEERSVQFSREKAETLGLGNAHFSVGDGTGIDFPDEHFDMVFASNVTSFIPDREKAVAEYSRVLRPFGVLAAVPIFYHQAPPAALLARVEEAIGAPLPQWSRDDWLEIFDGPGSTLFFSEEHEYVDLSPSEIDAYVGAVLAQPCNAAMAEDIRDAAAGRLKDFYTLFNENLRYARYAIMLFRKSQPTPFPVLHVSVPVAGTLVRR